MPADAKPKFEVATIKPGQPNQPKQPVVRTVWPTGVQLVLTLPDGNLTRERELPPL